MKQKSNANTEVKKSGGSPHPSPEQAHLVALQFLGNSLQLGGDILGPGGKGLLPVPTAPMLSQGCSCLSETLWGELRSPVGPRAALPLFPVTAVPRFRVPLYCKPGAHTESTPALGSQGLVPQAWDLFRRGGKGRKDWGPQTERASQELAAVPGWTPMLDVRSTHLCFALR